MSTSTWSTNVKPTHLGPELFDGSMRSGVAALESRQQVVCAGASPPESGYHGGEPIRHRPRRCEAVPPPGEKARGRAHKAPTKAVRGRRACARWAKIEVLPFVWVLVLSITGVLSSVAISDQ